MTTLELLDAQGNVLASLPFEGQVDVTVEPGSPLAVMGVASARVVES